MTSELFLNSALADSLRTTNSHSPSLKGGYGEEKGTVRGGEGDDVMFRAQEWARGESQAGEHAEVCRERRLGGGRTREEGGGG